MIERRHTAAGEFNKASIARELFSALLLLGRLSVSPEEKEPKCFSILTNFAPKAASIPFEKKLFRASAKNVSNHCARLEPFA